MNRQLEVGKTYRAKNGAKVTVTEDCGDGDLAATIVGDPALPGSPDNMYYSRAGRCYGVSRLNIDWDIAPDTDQSAPDTALMPDIIIEVQGGTVQEIHGAEGTGHLVIRVLDHDNADCTPPGSDERQERNWLTDRIAEMTELLF